MLTEFKFNQPCRKSKSINDLSCLEFYRRLWALGIEKPEFNGYVSFFHLSVSFKTRAGGGLQSDAVRQAEEFAKMFDLEVVCYA